MSPRLSIRPHWRKMSWVVLIWNVLMVVWIIAGVAGAHNGQNCTASGLSQQACNDASNAGVPMQARNVVGKLKMALGVARVEAGRSK